MDGEKGNIFKSSLCYLFGMLYDNIYGHIGWKKPKIERNFIFVLVKKQ